LFLSQYFICKFPFLDFYAIISQLLTFVNRNLLFMC
jgi:hypothetical protein